jgi:Holliday junction resolvasome RuvABC endonuclease subunit
MHKKTLIVGLDMSLRSTGIAVYNTTTKNIFTYFYPGRIKDELMDIKVKCKWKETEFNVCALPVCDNQQTMMHRYNRITGDIIEIIKKHGGNSDNTAVYMEGYSYDSVSSRLSNIHELGGIMKYRLYVEGIHVHEVPPSRIKKKFADTGRAKKTDMFNSFISKGFPDLLGIFAMQNRHGIPNPVQDIVDACALVDISTDIIETS